MTSARSSRPDYGSVWQRRRRASAAIEVVTTAHYGLDAKRPLSPRHVQSLQPHQGPGDDPAGFAPGMTEPAICHCSLGSSATRWRRACASAPTRTPGRMDAGHDSGDTAPRARYFHRRVWRLWPFLAIPAADERPRRMAELHPRVRRGECVDDAFLVSDAMRDAALTRRAALRSAFADVHAHAELMTLRNQSAPKRAHLQATREPIAAVSLDCSG